MAGVRRSKVMGEVDAGRDYAEFRREVRDWLEANCPPEMRDGAAGEDSICWGGTSWTFTCAAQKTWLDRCVERGFTVPTWPKAYGGAGLSRDEDKILKEEMQAIGAGAINQAIKAVAIARGFVAPSGVDLVCVPAFTDIRIDGEERTAIKLIVQPK